nr:MAG TPA: hypothetical protein [Crassvirales sp.]
MPITNTSSDNWRSRSKLQRQPVPRWYLVKRSS